MKHLLLVFFLFPLLVSAQHFSTTTFEVKPLPVLPIKDLALQRILEQNEEYKKLDKEKQDWYYWTNYSRQQPKRFWDSVVNPLLQTYPKMVSKYTSSLKADLYATPVLPIIAPDLKLMTLAQDHANDLGRKKANPSHTSTNGKTFQQRMIDNQVNRCAAENISFGPPNPVMALVLLYIDENLPDLGHRKNLMNPAFTNMGIGISTYPNNMILVVQDLACNQAL